MSGLIQFIKAFPKARASLTSFNRWHVSGDDVRDKKLFNLLMIILVATINGHILWILIRCPMATNPQERQIWVAIKCDSIGLTNLFMTVVSGTFTEVYDCRTPSPFLT
jgi:hypothetical protein